MMDSVQPPLRSTYRASSDVALVKYWGKRDAALRIPENNSISMLLAGLDTVTTVEFDPKLMADEVRIGNDTRPIEVERVSQHLDRVRLLAGSSLRARVVSENRFPPRHRSFQFRQWICSPDSCGDGCSRSGTLHPRTEPTGATGVGHCLPLHV